MEPGVWPGVWMTLREELPKERIWRSSRKKSMGGLCGRPRGAAPTGSDQYEWDLWAFW
ncbi:MAG: hypothetical protein UW41_C0023G0007 [Candidatus Collierbacteria bacterium GW2011_GWC2_44_18]|uniref:Uncharacterized protein n=1 Tax=Candidatus Collierbacteria bacterium GW2011_GWC2_44_18 TaxID=1618392 RepID=A0A0G1HPQ1_9BACT|nr:MAG: hypothetical protein UW16_C0014G0007 [Microgenomates group bacterium GW2011_GWC1_44_10]KKT48613.1 MAG: hypothetical protein UW41_C0023G0007 [Candidatus Collierbacteria bacterium GW2011_GWC2_44_18]